MKRFSESQLRVIIALNMVIIFVLGGLLLHFLPMTDSSATPAVIIPEPYKRVRPAAISLNPDLSWELELEGDSDDEAVFTFINDENETLYVFGNTKSASRDFERPGIFLAAVDVYGKTRENGFFIYGKETDVLKSVTPGGDGFVLAVEGDRPYLITVDFSGASRIIDGFTQPFERVWRIVKYNGGYMLFTQPEDTMVRNKKLRCFFFDNALTYKTDSIVEQAGYSLEPVAVVSTFVCLSAVAGQISRPMLTEFIFGGSPKKKLVDSYPGKVVGMMPCEDGLAVLTDYGGSSLFTFSLNFEQNGEPRFLAAANPLFFTDLDDNFNAVFTQSSTQILSAAMLPLRVLPAFAPYSLCQLYDTAFIAGSGLQTGQKEISVNIYREGLIKYSVSVGEGSNPLVNASPKYIFCTYNKEGSIIIAALRYPLYLNV